MSLFNVFRGLEPATTKSQTLLLKPSGSCVVFFGQPGLMNERLQSFSRVIRTHLWLFNTVHLGVIEKEMSGDAGQRARKSAHEGGL